MSGPTALDSDNGRGPGAPDPVGVRRYVEYVEEALLKGEYSIPTIILDVISPPLPGSIPGPGSDRAPM